MISYPDFNDVLCIHIPASFNGELPHCGILQSIHHGDCGITTWLPWRYLVAPYAVLTVKLYSLDISFFSHVWELCILVFDTADYNYLDEDILKNIYSPHLVSNYNV